MSSTPAASPPRDARQLSAFEVVPGQLVAVGGALPLDGRLSWAPPDATGFQPTNAYLLLRDGKPLIVNPGIAFVGPGVAAGLRTYLPDGAEVDLFISRSGFDSVGNVGVIAEHFQLRRAHTGGSFNPFDAFGAAGQIDDRTNWLEIERSPEDSALEIIHASLRLLNTYWAYDEPTKTLFTSDAFSHATINDLSEPRIITRTEDDPTTPADVKAYLLATFPWFNDRPVTAPIVAGLQDVFESHDVETIAPDRGCVLHGADVVATHVEMMTAALREVARDV